MLLLCFSSINVMGDFYLKAVQKEQSSQLLRCAGNIVKGVDELLCQHHILWAPALVNNVCFQHLVVPIDGHELHQHIRVRSQIQSVPLPVSDVMRVSPVLLGTSAMMLCLFRQPV